MRDRNPEDRYVVTPAGFLFCQDCGCLVMEGYRAEHDEYMHDEKHEAQIRLRRS